MFRTNESQLESIYIRYNACYLWYKHPRIIRYKCIQSIQLVYNQVRFLKDENVFVSKNMFISILACTYK